MYEQAIALTSDIDKSTYNEQNFWAISPTMFRKINEKVPGKAGNARTLLLYLIFQRQNSSFSPAEQTICDACGFTSVTRYKEAREFLCKMGLITHIPYKEIRINYLQIMK